MLGLVEFLTEGINWNRCKIDMNKNMSHISDFNKSELDNFWQFINKELKNTQIFEKIKETDQDKFKEKFFKFISKKGITVKQFSQYSHILNAYAYELYMSGKKDDTCWCWSLDRGKSDSACMVAVLFGLDTVESCLKTPTDKKWKKMFKPKEGALLFKAFNNFEYDEYCEDNKLDNLL